MKTTTLEYLTLCMDGHVIVQFMKRLADPDTGQEAFREPHRGVVPPLMSVEEALAQINANLVKDLRYPPLSDVDIKTVIAQAEAWHRVPAVAATIANAKKAALAPD
ncbi:hypothetical protein NKI20_02185 [Mesorhizobium sp. M0830]|uniref:hypothetical protein n=1 Tax=Mesorhizobium sp. M0830 TaxID=2957008 RepID=UPI0033381B41